MLRGVLTLSRPDCCRKLVTELHRRTIRSAAVPAIPEHKKKVQAESNVQYFKLLDSLHHSSRKNSAEASLRNVSRSGQISRNETHFHDQAGEFSAARNKSDAAGSHDEYHQEREHSSERLPPRNNQSMSSTKKKLTDASDTNSLQFKNKTQAKQLKEFIRQLEIKDKSVHKTESLTNSNSDSFSNLSQVELVDPPPEINFDDLDELAKYEPNALSTDTQDLNDMAPYTPQSFNLAAYVARSPTLQELIKLGVDLSQWDKLEEVPEMILAKDFEKDIKPYVTFLHDVGVEAKDIGHVLTRAPFILTENLDDLQTRINYFKVKKFKKYERARIVTKAPKMLTKNVRLIDGRLGHIQKIFDLTGDEMRYMITRVPRMILTRELYIRECQFAVTEQMGFSKEETKKLLLAHPKIFISLPSGLVKVFDYVHNVMKISHELILQCPMTFITRITRLKPRHLFLQHLGRAQYDPVKEGYVCLRDIVYDSDVDFCLKSAKTSIEEFNDFLKTL